MAKVIGLPKLSPTMDEGTLVAWSKKEGDKVEIDDLLAEVETDKATMEFRSFDAGVLLAILVPAGETLKPDTPVAIIGKAGEDVSKLVAEAKGGAAKAPKAEPKKDEAPKASNGEQKKAAPKEEAAPKEDAPKQETSGRVMASPLVRKLGREHDVDLAQVHGSGPHGRVVKKDLDAFLAKGPASSGPRGQDRVEKVSQMRKTIARRLTESKRDIPHYYLTIDVDAEPLLAAREQINEVLGAGGSKDVLKISVNDLLIKACAVALRRKPEVNASFLGDEVAYHDRVDISVAVAIPDGLITPVVRDADRKGVAEIARDVRELAGRAKDKKLKPEEFTNGTFSISNLGMFGIEQFTAVINPPEGAILAVGAVREEPVVKNGAVVPGKRLRMTMSCDHRVIDGAVGAQFLQVLKSLLEKPATLVL